MSIRAPGDADSDSDEIEVRATPPSAAGVGFTVVGADSPFGSRMKTTPTWTGIGMVVKSSPSGVGFATG